VRLPYANLISVITQAFDNHDVPSTKKSGEQPTFPRTRLSRSLDNYTIVLRGSQIQSELSHWSDGVFLCYNLRLPLWCVSHGAIRSICGGSGVHELPVTESILEVATEAANNAGATRILSISLVIGDLSSIVDDSVQFYFDILSKGTMAEGATLSFQREAAKARCLACGHVFEVTPPLVPYCPVCGQAQLQVSGGKEFYLESIEVDND
jgi:hydrogenase nickel incorporation protein HypA/HybF